MITQALVLCMLLSSIHTFPFQHPYLPLPKGTYVSPSRSSLYSREILNSSISFQSNDIPAPTTGCLEDGKGGFTCKKTFPTMDQIRYWMQPEKGGGLDSERVPMFYAKWGSKTDLKKGIAWGQEYLKQQSPPRDEYDFFNGVSMTGADYWFRHRCEYLSDNYKDFWLWGQPGLYANKMRPRLTFEACYFQALSQYATQPDAYVMMPTGAAASDTWWLDVELPYLTNNDNIHTIYRVDPRPPSKGGPTDCPWSRIVWKRGVNDPLPAEYDCPTKPYPADPEEPPPNG